MGLRSLFFALAGIMGLFHYLRLGLAVILSFIGLKMMLAEAYPIPIPWALAAVASILLLSIVASLIFPPAQEAPQNTTRTTKHQA